MTMKVLHLTIKKKWFDMILSGEKSEEYRQIKPYWTVRLHNYGVFVPSGKENDFIAFDAVQLRNGYSPTSPTILVECKGIDIGQAVPEWSDNWQGNVFRIKLGKIIDGNCLTDCNYGNNHIIPTESRVKLINE